jgi:hypothetical protein
MAFAKQLVGTWSASFVISRQKKLGIRTLVQSGKDEKVIKFLHETSGIHEDETFPPAL